MKIKDDSVIFTIDDLLKIHKIVSKKHPSETIVLESGLKSLAGSWTNYKIVDKEKLMLFIIKYGFLPSYD